MASLAAVVLWTSVLLAGAGDRSYVVTLDPAAAIDGVEAMAARLAATYGGAVEEVSGDRFVIRLAASRVRLLTADPSVASVVAAAPEIAAATETVNWSAGVSYSYDASGNIFQIGQDRFAYDSVNRLVRAEVNHVTRSYDYDAPGNRTRCSQPEGDCQLGATINTSNNRIKEAGYDDAGNLRTFASRSYAYDALNMQTRDIGTGREFVYTADNERLAIYDTSVQAWRWTVRDTSAKVLRELTSSGATGTPDWKWVKDYVWRDGVLLASRQIEQDVLAPTRYHYHVDHLGTPRRVTDARDRIVGVHDYHAFGPEVSGGTNESSLTAIKYTGHERDLSGAAALDYMHARFNDPLAGRFLSVDPVISDDARRNPQLWNRYAYAANNPVGNVDPDGRLLAPWHYVITVIAARREGFSWRQAFSLGWRNVKVDFKKGSQSKDAKDTNVHAMRGTKPNNQVQTPAEARQATEQSVQTNLSTNTVDSVATALHTVQDRETPMHRDRVWPGMQVSGTVVRHVLEDIFPSPSTVKAAYSATRQALQQVKQINEGTPIIPDPD